MLIAEALRLLRTRKKLTQTAAAKNEGAPDFRTVSHWETGRKVPSLLLLNRYLRSLDFDFRDLETALEHVEGRPPKPIENGVGRLERRVAELEERLGLVLEKGLETAPEPERQRLAAAPEG